MEGTKAACAEAKAREAARLATRAAAMRDLGCEVGVKSHSFRLDVSRCCFFFSENAMFLNFFRAGREGSMLRANRK